MPATPVFLMTRSRAPSVPLALRVNSHTERLSGMRRRSYAPFRTRTMGSPADTSAAPLPRIVNSMRGFFLFSPLPLVELYFLVSEYSLHMDHLIRKPLRQRVPN